MKKCSCKHELGHPCNASFCWCDEHREEALKKKATAYIKKNFSKVIKKLSEE